MSQQRAVTVRERIEDVRRRIPPPAGRQARKDYISKEDFADLVGVTRSRIFAWTRTTNPEYPDEEAQKRLAELSEGVYAAEDFARPGQEAGSLADRVAGVERAVERLERHIFGKGAARAQ